MRRSTVLSLPLQLVFLGLSNASTAPLFSTNIADFASIGLSLDKLYKNKPGANVIKLFTAVIYHHSMVIPSFCVIKQHYLGNYCRMAVNYRGICVINVIKPTLLT
jgi:hypothetical protein